MRDETQCCTSKLISDGRLTKVVGESDDDDGEPDRHPDATHDETPPCLARARQRAVGSFDHPSSAYAAPESVERSETHEPYDREEDSAHQEAVELILVKNRVVHTSFGAA